MVGGYWRVPITRPTYTQRVSEGPTEGRAIDVAVVLVVFNRPELTAASFAAIRAVRPTKLFVIADGPREGHESDVDRCTAVRQIVDDVDWPCAVERDYADANLGLKRRVETGLDLVFKQVDRAIVLEDDCIAAPEFFTFCVALLDRYATDERVMAVTGDNFQDGIRRGEGSYYFSKYPHCWGWATWSRAWAHYTGGYTEWSADEHSVTWHATHPDPVERRYWRQAFDAGASGRLSSWAYPWTDAVWRRGGLTATPAENLVRNVGFGPEATHTKGAGVDHPRQIGGLDDPLEHPARVEADAVADRYTFDHHFGGRHLSAMRTPLGFTKYCVARALSISGRLGNRWRRGR